jgi:hypothetical protein
MAAKYQSTKWDGLTVYNRAVWLPPGAKKIPGGVKQEVKPDSTLFVHYSAFAGMNVDSLDEQVAVMRAMYHHHTAVNGWDDIGYNFIVFQPYGSLRLAAQYGYNTGNLAVCVVTQDEAIKPSTVSRLKSIYRRVECQDLLGHRDVNNTACPGKKLYALLPEIRNAKK